MKISNYLKARYAKLKIKNLKSKFKCYGIGCEFELNNRFVFPERIEIGNHVYIGPSGYFNGRGGLTIADHVIIAPEIAVMTSMHRFKEAEMVPYDQVEWLNPVSIEQCVWVGLRAIIMPGVTIGEGSIVGAGAVVTRSCPPGSILCGNPAKIIGSRDISQYKRCLDAGKFYLKKKQEGAMRKEEVFIRIP